MEEMEVEELEEEEERRFSSDAFVTLSQQDVMEFLEQDVEGEDVAMPSGARRRHASGDEDGNQGRSGVASSIEGGSARPPVILTPPGKPITFLHHSSHFSLLDSWKDHTSRPSHFLPAHA